MLALVGNPNAGKTTLFNALTGLRAKTANFPGTTIERRVGRMKLEAREIDLLDLPGLYSLTATTPEETVASDALSGSIPDLPKPEALLLIVDATNLERNLFLASQVLELKIPTLIALNMIDLAERGGIKVDAKALAHQLGCPVVPIAARSGRGVPRLREELTQLLEIPAAQAIPKPASPCGACKGCQFKARYDWAEKVGAACSSGRPETHGQRTERIDRFLTHPVVGVVAFHAVMVVVFSMIFYVAAFPMNLIRWLFETGAGAVSHGMIALSNVAPEGALRHFIANDLRSLVAQGVLGGVGGVLVFLPQICILFFFLSLLEDTGYLARAAFVMDRLMRRVGLPGKAFVPMLSAHACAIPGIMATRVIEDKRDRLVTILVLPLMSCSARIPVYAMVVALLFPNSPVKAGLLFTGAYALGILAALSMALLFKRTILPGQSKPLVLELPSYKMPSLRNALMTMYDRAMVFVMKAGSVILLVSVLLWALAYYPRSAPPAAAVDLQQQAQQAQASGHADQAHELAQKAEALTAQSALAHSAAGRVGHTIEPVIRPLGFDWQIGIGILSSFAAREVLVSTLGIVYGLGEGNDDQPDKFVGTLRTARRSDGGLVFTTATCVSLLVFYVLAMQCASTLAVTRRETNSWKWPAFQFAYMTVLAYVAALIAYQTLLALHAA